jgi:CDGSH-type Zn-finger protein
MKAAAKETAMTEFTITPTDNGPNIVQGTFRVVDVEGNELEFKGKAVALCRCGGSANKPFCDGTHAKIGFQSVVRAQSKAAV